jgi:hypothetical protein
VIERVATIELHQMEALLLKAMAVGVALERGDGLPERFQLNPKEQKVCMVWVSRILAAVMELHDEMLGKTEGPTQ